MGRKNVLLFLFLMLIACLFFYFFYSPSSLKAKRNVEKIKQVYVGMEKSDMLRIMGIPDNKRLSFLNNTDSMYYYEPPFGASEGIYVQFDSIGIVNKIVDYK